MFGILLVFTIITILVFLVTVHLRRLNLQKRFSKFQFISGLPLIGNLFITIGHDNEDYVKLVLNLFEKSGESPGFTWMGTELVFGIDKPEDFQSILSSEKLVKKGFMYSFLGHLNGLFTATPKIWKNHRRLLNSTLSQKMVTNFVPTFNEVSAIMTKQMEEFVGGDIDMYRVMFKASGDSILKTSFGIDWSIQSERGNQLHDALTGWMGCIQQRVMRFWLKWNSVYHLTEQYQNERSLFHTLEHFYMAAYEAKVVDLAEKKIHGFDEINEANEKNNMNFIQKCIKLKDENKFTMDDIRDELGTLFVASLDTSAIAIKVITLMLAINQEYQERVLDEMREIFENADDPVTSDDLAKMTFLELIIKESFRLFPIGPFAARECIQDFEFRDTIIPKGTIFVMNVLKMQRDPIYWGENSLEFLPERFLPENFANIPPYAYVPFSAGLRNCIGYRYALASLKVSLAYILRQYKLTSKLRFQDIRIQANIVLKIMNENPVQLQRREWKKK